MKTADIKAMMADLAPVIKEFTAAALAPLASRLDTLEKLVEAAPAPKDGPDLALVERVFQSDVKAVAGELRSEMKALVPDVERMVTPLIAGAIKDYAATVKPPKEVDLEPLIRRIEENAAKYNVALEKALASFPKPVDADAIVAKAVSAVSADLDAIRAAVEAIPAPGPLPDVKALVAEAVSALPPAPPGITVDDVRPLIAETVQRAVAALPKPERGEPGKNGAGVASAMIDRKGCLVLTLSDGSTKDLGNVVGASVDPKDVAALVESAVQKAIAAIPPAEPGKPGKSVTVDDVAPMIRELVDKATATIPAAIEVEVHKMDVPAADREALVRLQARLDEVKASLPSTIERIVAALPKPEKGKDADPIETKRMVDEAVAAAVAALPPPQKGKDADPEQVAALVKTEAERILGGWERPRDGKSVTVEELRPVVDEAVRKAVAGIPVPKDGVSLAGALIDRGGNLILTLSNGETKELGKVVGTNGADADMVALERVAREMIAAIPAPKDGEDGVGFDDIDLVESEDGILIRFAKGGNVKDFLLPVVVDRGVWKAGDTHHRGAGVTFDGSFWISQQDRNTDKPGTSKTWRLAVRKGKDRTDPVKLDG
jgi:hypothetical protein